MGNVANPNAKSKRREFCFTCMNYFDESREAHDQSAAHEDAFNKTIYECETGEGVEDDTL